MASSVKVIEVLERYLEFRKFRNIHINYSIGEISAERKKNFFTRKDQLKLIVRQINDSITNVELTINEESKQRSTNEMKEEKLREKIYSFL